MEDFRVASGVLEGGWVGLGRRAEIQSQPPVPATVHASGAWGEGSSGVCGFER